MGKLDKLTLSYQLALEKILREARKFDDLWDAKPETEVIVVSAMVEQDESLEVKLGRKDRKYGFSVNGIVSPKLYEAQETARIIKSLSVHGRFVPQDWTNDFYERIRGPLGEYLADEFIKKRK